MSIPVKKNMQLSFWKYTATELGKYTNVDLVFASGKTLRDQPAYKDQNGTQMHPGNARGTLGAWEKFTCVVGLDSLVGDHITQMILSYDHGASSGEFLAYFDDICIDIASDTNPVAIRNGNIQAKKVHTVVPLSSLPELIINSDKSISVGNPALLQNVSVVVYDLQGRTIARKSISDINQKIVTRLADGRYFYSIIGQKQTLKNNFIIR